MMLMARRHEQQDEGDYDGAVVAGDDANELNYRRQHAPSLFVGEKANPTKGISRDALRTARAHTQSRLCKVSKKRKSIV